MNTITIIGRLTADPEVRKTPSGKSVCNFTVAVNRRFNREKVDFINCTAWGQTADYVGQYQIKGSLVAVRGELNIEPYETREGDKRWKTFVTADEVQGLSRAEKAEQKQEQPETEPYIDPDDDLPF